MEVITTRNGNKYEILFGYGILAQYSSSMIKHVSEETVKELRKRATESDGVQIREDEVLDIITDEDFKNIAIGNVDFGLEIMAKAIRSCNGKSIGRNYEERYDYVMGMDPKDGRDISEEFGQKVIEFQAGMNEQGESKPSYAKPEAEKAALPL